MVESVIRLLSRRSSCSANSGAGTAGTLVGIRFGQGDLRTHAYRSLSCPIVPFPKPLPELCQLGAQRDWLQELDPVTER